MFYRVLYPAALDSNTSEQSTGTISSDQMAFMLRRLLRFTPAPSTPLEGIPIVVFDFESTGLDTESDSIIEIGAEKLVDFKVTAEFSTLVQPPRDLELSDQVIKLTGITPEMLDGQPPIAAALPDFFKFIEGCILVAHNADFDFRLMRAEASRLGYDIEWPCFCTLKMAREILPDLENRKLDTLATHYGLTFGSRHRSMGDVRVTSQILEKFITEDGDDLTTWESLKPFYTV